MTRSPSEALRAATICERAPSTSFPNSTPDGHAVSHARQSRQVFMWSSKAAASAPRRPSHTFFIKRMRPRGESISTPRTAKVGHVGRQRPQCTHRAIRSSEGASAFGYGKNARGADLRGLRGAKPSSTRLANGGAARLEHPGGVEGVLQPLHEEVAPRLR